MRHSSIRRWLAAGLLCTGLLPSLAFGQATPDHQPLGQRQVCTTGAVHDRPGGREVGEAAQGLVIELTDMDFDADGTPYLIYGSKDDPRAIRADRTAHFCGFSDRVNARPMVFVAPPNSCHVIAASSLTLDRVNTVAAEHAEYMRTMNVFRDKDGGYAVSLGLVSNAVATEVLADGRNIPSDAYCSDGVEYVDVMEKVAGQFMELDPPAPTDPDARRAEAVALSEGSTEGDRSGRLRRACHLGDGPSCTVFASELKATQGLTDDNLPEITRFNLLGCMLGEPIACNNLLAGLSDGFNKTVFTSFPDRTGAASAPPTLDPEFARVGCDAHLAPSCRELASPLISYALKDAGSYITSLEAMYHACVEARQWYCREFGDRISYRDTAMGTSWSPVANLGFAHIFSRFCSLGDEKMTPECELATKHYGRFLDSGEGREDQRAAAAGFMRDSCAAGMIDACARQSQLSAYFTTDDRKAAAAKVVSACEAGTVTNDICTRLDRTLGSDLAEAKGPMLSQYETLAEACRNEEATDGSDPCRRAFSYYAEHISGEDIDAPLALLKENCRSDGRITGCATLSDIYKGEQMQFGDVLKAWPAQTALSLAALTTGCVATLEAVGNCGSLGIDREREGDFTAANAAYWTGCETGMTAGEGQRYGQGRVCYWAAKNARNNLHDYANARRWYQFGCDNADPWACKFLGLMHAQAEGGAADPLTAMSLYRRACYLEADITVGDGQACYFLGQAQKERRNAIVSDEPDFRPVLPEDGPEEELVAANLMQASRAFLRGCLDDVAESCKAQNALLKEWADGTYPRRVHDCRLMSADGVMAPVQKCQGFSMFLRAPEGLEEARPASVFVWPDGDRTVIAADAGRALINGVSGEPFFPENNWTCIRSSVTGRSFCHVP